MTSHQIIERRLCTVIISKSFAVKDHVEAPLFMNDGNDTPSSFVIPAYLHGHCRTFKSFIWSWSFARLGVGADSRSSVNRHRYYNRWTISKSRSRAFKAHALPVTRNISVHSSEGVSRHA